MAGSTERPADSRLSLRPFATGSRNAPPRVAAEAVETHQLTIRLIDRAGESAAVDGVARAINLDTGDSWYVGSGDPQRLPAGRYAIHAQITTWWRHAEPEGTIVAHPEFRLDGDKAFTFDARDAHPISVRTDQPTVRGGAWVVWAMSKTGDGGVPMTGFGADPQFTVLSVYTVPGVESESFAFVNRYTLLEPSVELFTVGEDRFEVPAFWEWDQMPLEPSGHWRLPTVYARQGRPQDIERLDLNGRLVVLEIPAGTTRGELYPRIRAIRDAGGRMVAFDVDSANPELTIAEAEEPTAIEPALPTLWLSGSAAAWFVDAVRDDAVGVDLTGRAVSRYRYDLAFPEFGKVAADQSHVVRDDQLAAIRTRYYECGFPAPRGIPIFHVFGTGVDSGYYQRTMKRGVRTEYFTPGRWRIGLSGCFIDHVEPARTLRAGRTYQLSWGAAVRGPRFGDSDWTRSRGWAYRLGDRIDVQIPMLADAAGHLGPVSGTATRGATSLYRNGELVRIDPRPARGVFDVPTEEAHYRLTSRTRWSAPVDWWPVSTEVRVAWTFRSANPGTGNGSTLLPLLAVRYAPDVDLRHRAPGGGRFEFPVTVRRQDLDEAPEIRRLRLSVSYDDGETWQPASLATNDDDWTASVDHPERGYASLRAHVTDADGNTSTQTIVRAYRIGR